MLFGKHFNKYYAKYWFFFIFGVLTLIAIDYLQTFIPEAIGGIVALLKDPGTVDVPAVHKLALEVVGIGALMMVGRFLWRLCLMWASGRIRMDIRSEMFAKSERLSQRYYHTEKVGNIVSWFTSDLETIADYVGWGTVMLVDAIFLTILVMVKMFMMSVPLTLLVLIPILLIATWGLLSEIYLTKIWETRQASNDRLYDFSTEAFSGIRVIKAFVKEKQQARAFKKVAKQCQKDSVKVAEISGLFERLIDVLLHAIFGAFLIVGGYFAFYFSQGTTQSLFGMEINLKTEELVTFIAYFDTLIWPVIALGSVIAMHSRAKASLQRTSAYLDQEEEIILADGTEPLKDVKGEIEFNDLTFSYPGTDYPVLKNINLKIKAGETVGIVGKIGSGKTTLVDCLLRLYNFDENRVKIDGIDIMKAKIDDVRASIAYVPQDNFLFSDTIQNNINFSKKDATEQDAKDAAIFSSVDQDIVEFKDGYNSLLGERGTTVSGGQKQRISMARAYLKDAPIMIMDDSVSAVDVKTETTILNNIKEKRAGRTTIIIASRISTVSKLDKVIVLNDGAVEAFGSPKELLATSKTYARMAMLQELDKEEGK
ncbi:MAG: ABC transporter ATP-binding protein/permease [Bacilli bacterium]|nr:ABC transporter ATP-binding protein/permease [Bacilli bacterium]